MGRDADARQYTCLEAGEADVNQAAIVEGVVFEDYDVPYEERIIQLRIVDVASFMQHDARKRPLRSGSNTSWAGRGASSTHYWGIGEMRNRAEPWRSPAAGAQGDGADIGVRRR